MSFFRYPGGKTKLRHTVVPILNNFARKGYEYREPFFGGGSFLLDLKFERIRINDADETLACLWNAVASSHAELKRRVMEFTPSVERFDEFKQRLLTKDHYEDPVETGFMKLAIHQISYSGLGPMSGGPLGGRNQKSPYKIDCRWNPTYICKKIDTYHDYLSKVYLVGGCCASADFSYIITEPALGIPDKPVVMYLDPPYYVKGEELYQHSFKHEDHIRLMEALKATSHKWYLSYDDCPEIRDLYKWAHIMRLDVNYTINGSTKKPEVLIEGG